MSDDEPDLTPEGIAERKAEQEQKAGRGFLVALAIGAVIVVAIAIGSSARDDGGGEVSDSDATFRPATVEVIYEVIGTAQGVDITIQNASGNTEQASARAVPLMTGNVAGVSIGQVRRGQFVYISAQNTGSTGTVTCRIRADGDVISEATSEGAYTIASCDGTA